MRRLANILILIVAVVVLYGMQKTKPRFGELTAPIPVYGQMHDQIHTREFNVMLDQVISRASWTSPSMVRRRC